MLGDLYTISVQGKVNKANGNTGQFSSQDRVVLSGLTDSWSGNSDAGDQSLIKSGLIHILVFHIGGGIFYNTGNAYLAQGLTQLLAY